MKKINSNINYTDNIYYICRTILIIGLPLTIISGLVLSHLSFHSSARVSSSDNLSISVPSSCTLSSSIDETHSASIINGTYESEIGKTTLTTFCNDRNGYSVYAIGYSLNSEGNNKLVGNINSNYDIASGTATNGNTSNWAMKLTGVTAITDNNSNTTVNANTPPTIISPFTNYTTVPTEWTKVATIASGTTDMLQGSGFTTAYATYISPTQAAGTYTGQVKYLLTHPSSAPAETYYMQEISEWAEGIIPNEGNGVIATDIRDGKYYWVTRLADGHIWMTQNLDFDITANTTLNSMTTDLNVAYNSATGQYAEYDDGYSAQNGIIYWTPASTATTIDFAGTAVTDWQNSNTEPYSASKTDDANTGHASLGNYYNWTAAIASNDSSTLTGSTYNNISNNPQNSICPKGWRLPTISDQSGAVVGSTNELGRLNSLYNDVLGTPLFFQKTGYIFSELKALNTTGAYTSSTVKNSTSIYGARISTNATKFTVDWWTNTDNESGGRSGGWSIRCLARTED